MKSKISKTLSNGFKRFQRYYFLESAYPAAANAYLALMGFCYLVVITLIIFRSPYANHLYIATGLTDVALHFSHKVKTRLPASIPLGALCAALLFVLSVRFT